VWHDTEQARSRRRYLVERFGPATPLPPRWLGRLRAANNTPSAYSGADADGATLVPMEGALVYAS
jgi:hypothetical protein